MNKAIPKISIITPSFNQGDYIEQTILSVLNQNYPNLEYIIIDGGSTDNTLNIIKKYEERLTYWVSEPDKGQTDAINKGFLKATGEIVNWLNSDDYLHQDALWNISQSFQLKKISVVTSVVNNFINEEVKWDEKTPSWDDKLDYITKGFNNQPGTFFKRSIWEQSFPLPIQLHYTMDQYLWFCFWLTHNIKDFKIENYTTVYFRRHENSKTSKSLKENVFNHLGPSFFNEHNLIFWSFFKKKSEELAQILTIYFSEDFDYQTKIIEFGNTIIIENIDTPLILKKYLLVLIKEDYRTRNYNRFRTTFNFLKTKFDFSNNPELKKLLFKQYLIFPLKGIDYLKVTSKKIKADIYCFIKSYKIV